MKHDLNSFNGIFLTFKHSILRSIEKEEYAEAFRKSVVYNQYLLDNLESIINQFRLDAKFDYSLDANKLASEFQKSLSKKFDVLKDEPECFVGKRVKSWSFDEPVSKKPPNVSENSASENTATNEVENVAEDSVSEDVIIDDNVVTDEVVEVVEDNAQENDSVDDVDQSAENSVSEDIATNEVEEIAEDEVSGDGGINAYDNPEINQIVLDTIEERDISQEISESEGEQEHFTDGEQLAKDVNKFSKSEDEEVEVQDDSSENRDRIDVSNEGDML